MIFISAGHVPPKENSLKWFNNLKIGSKLALAFGTCLASSGIIFVAGYSCIANLSEEALRLTQRTLPRVNSLGDIREAAANARNFGLRIAITDDVAGRATWSKKLAEEQEVVKTAFAAYGAKVVRPDDRKNISEAQSAWTKQSDMLADIERLRNSNQTAAAVALLNGASRDQFFNDFRPKIDNVARWNFDRAKTLEAEIAATKARIETTMYGALALGVFAALAFGFITTKAIRGQVTILAERLESLRGHCLTKLGDAIVALKNGDLTVRAESTTDPIPNPSKDELGQLTNTFNGMLSLAQSALASFREAQDGLAEMIRTVDAKATGVAATGRDLSEATTQTAQSSDEISQTIQQVAHATSEAAQTSQQIAGGSEQLARAATDAAGEMERLESAIDTVQSTSQAQRESTERAAEVATEGTKSVAKIIASMESIQAQVDRSSASVQDLGTKQHQIGAIVQTINEIAEQTNLLALNAAIEAARAGEHGRGFAVVADEVRKLAERSAQATKEIENLIASVRSGVEEAINTMNASATEVANGAAYSDSAREALEQILASVKELRTLSESNSAEVSRMVVGAKTVSGAISSVAAISEQTAAGAQELSASNQEVFASAEQVSAAVQEQSASVEEVSAMAQSLSATADELNKLVVQFKIENASSTPGHLRIAA
jgi:methyl-accepting chemotaxis protein